jgi:hypothetical protein
MVNEYIPYRFGFIAVKKGFVTPEQVSEALEIQLDEDMSEQPVHRLLGEIMLERGILNPAQLSEILGEMVERDTPPKEDISKRFGMIATNKGYITPEQLKKAMWRQVKEEYGSKKHRPIGEILLELGHLEPPQLNEILEELLEENK